jgi:[ribosomal protein S18]-alanine N-acetyltransferase
MNAADAPAYVFRPLAEHDARQLLGWRYQPPFDFYNSYPESLDEDLRELLDPELAYHAILDGGQLVAFCCFGADARVPGGDYRTPALDVGWGMRPDLTGQGRGVALVAAILDHGRMLYAPPAFRATVAAWNTRSQRVCQRNGFTVVQHFEHPAPWSERGRYWVVLLRDERPAQ